MTLIFRVFRDEFPGGRGGLFIVLYREAPPQGPFCIPILTGMAPLPSTLN